MRQIVRENAPCALVAGAGCAVMAWLGLYGFGWNDYDTEARPAFEALVHGHVAEFLRLAPAYGGSLIERAPFALVPGLWGGGALAVYRMVALPCLLATTVLATWLVARARAQGRSWISGAIVLGVCVANPITLYALEFGHPEELLGGCLCVAAVLMAARSRGGRDHSLLAGLLLGLAVANKDWALLAAGPVALALPPGRRARCLSSACLSAAVVLAPLVLASSSGFAAGTRAVATPSAAAIFKPWQLWWFLGHYSPLARGPSGLPQPGYRLGPNWVGSVSHPLILATAPVLALLLWARSRRTALPEQQALLALALIFLLRCLLDTWDEIYYLLPFVFALLAWELSLDGRRPPLLAVAGSVLVWFNFWWLESYASPDVQAGLFLAWSVPLTVWLGRRLLLSARALESTAHASPGSLLAYETTVSALGRPVKTS